MTARYEFWLLAPDADYALDYLETPRRFTAVRALNAVGQFELVLPGSWDYRLARLDSRLAVWRRPSGGRRYLEAAFLVRSVERVWDNGTETVVLRGPDYNDLLASRIVAYATGSSQAEKSAAADNLMRAVVRENLGASATDSDRDLSAVGFSVEADTGSASSLDMAFAWKNVLRTLQDVARAAWEKNSERIYFGVVPLGSGWSSRFQVRVGWWNADHRYPGGAHGPLMFGPGFGNVSSVRVGLDRRKEFNHVYAGGRGEEDERIVVEAETSSLVDDSPLNRRESFFDGRSYDTTARLTAAANARLREGRPLRIAEARVDKPSRDYGVSWWFGDLLTVTYGDESFDAIACKVRLDWADGEERLQVWLEEI